MLNVQQQPLYAPRTGPQQFVPVAGLPMGMPMMPGVPVAVPVPPMAHRGTLQPGQKVQVGQYEVVVEKYLAEGGYAHVYLVNTPSPMMGETRHVLKRIACASDDILREVGMEVQVMKLLRGHPNIVHLHSATSEPHPDGSSVVYILMEFCAGGGIIDYMNRRLRERLTEKEILQIFVDVCEAVASMHALKPPLLHRDLKIENILQSTPTSYKLCDFGSAAAVMPPPSNIVQLRLLEADLNKHTTLQYRAPEMVDVYQRRAIDTKSDVWALGVLLYKLCYYTTPFEAHGPVAIMTASYKIPSYPVYSPELNGLIGKMLQERGSNRPSVFEILDEVHRMRGTRSKFHYEVSGPAPLSPTKPLKSPALTSPLTTRKQLAPPLSPPLRTHISGPPARRGATTDLLEDVQRAERGRQAGLHAAMRRPDGKISPAFTPASPAERAQPSFGEEKSRPAPAPKPSYVSARIGQLGQQQAQQATSPPAQERAAPSLTPKPSSTRPASIALPSPALSLAEAGVAAKSRTPAFLSPGSKDSLSAEERFPSIDQLSSELDQAFSPPAAERTRPILEQTPLSSPTKPAERESAPWLARRSQSPTKPSQSSQAGQFQGIGISARSTGVRGSAMQDRPVFSPLSANAAGTMLSSRPGLVGRPLSAGPAMAVKPAKAEAAPADKPSSSRAGMQTAKTAIPERTNPPMKRLESDFAKPRKRTRKRTSTTDVEDSPPASASASASAAPTKQQSEPQPERKPGKPRDWLTGSFDADDPTLAPPSLPGKPSVQVKPTALKSDSSPSKPALAQRPSESSVTALRQFVQSPDPVKEAATSPPAETSPSRTSPFKRHSVAVAQPGASMPSLTRGNDGPAPRLPARPQSGVFSPPSLQPVTSARPSEKPAFLRNNEGPPTTQRLKVDTSARKPVPTLTDNWSPIESKTHRRKESSDDDGPEDVNGGTIRNLRRQFEQPLPAPKRAPVAKPASLVSQPATKPDFPKSSGIVPPDSPTKAFAARFPDLVSLDTRQSQPAAAGKATQPPARRSPLPSPNIMDEENEELPATVSSRFSVFSNRNGAQPKPVEPSLTTTSSSRPRPQSMFLSSSMMQNMASLQPPPDSSAVVLERRTPRRGSISDMVSKYESLTSPTLSKPEPRPPSNETVPPSVLPTASVTGLSPKAPSPTTSKVITTKPSVAVEIPRKDITLSLSSGSNGNLARRRTVAAASSGGIVSAFGPPKAQVGLPGLAKLSSVPERIPSMPVRQNVEVVGDYKPRALPGLAKPPTSPTKQPSYLTTPTNATQPTPRATSPAQAGLPMRPISPIGMPLPTPKAAPVVKPTSLVAQTAPGSKPAPGIVSPTPRKADPSPRPPSATADGVESSFQGVGKLVAQWQKKAEELTHPAQNNDAEKKMPAWQRLR